MDSFFPHPWLHRERTHAMIIACSYSFRYSCALLERESGGVWVCGVSVCLHVVGSVVGKIIGDRHFSILEFADVDVAARTMSANNQERPRHGVGHSNWSLMGL